MPFGFQLSAWQFRLSCLDFTEPNTVGQILSQLSIFFCPLFEVTRLKDSGHAAHPSKVMEFSVPASVAETGGMMQICILFECIKIP